MHSTTILILGYCLSVAAATTTTTVDVKETKDEDRKYFNYLRLVDGECFNCSTYKCTDHKANMGGSDWCIMLFPDALAHCDSDPECGGYTMTTAEWFHEEYDKDGQVAVHLNRANEKTMPCPLPAEWSSYQKQTTVRKTPVIYGRSTCEENSTTTSSQGQNFDYKFVSQYNAAVGASPYSCKDHPNSLENKDTLCVLPIADAIKLCNADHHCEGFMINVDNDWQNKYARNGMQAAQLFGKGVTQTPSQMWRTFAKQH